MSSGTTANSTQTYFQGLIKDLRGAGFTYEKIAIECQLRGADYTPSAVKMLAHGLRQEPHYFSGQVIVSLHTKFCRTTIRSE